LVDIKWCPDSFGNDAFSTLLHSPKREMVVMSRTAPAATGVEPTSPEALVWTKKIRTYFLERESVESPRVLVGDDTESAKEALIRTSRWVYERRFEGAFEKCSTNLVICHSGGNFTIAPFEYVQGLEGLEVPEHMGILSEDAVKTVLSRLRVTTSRTDWYSNGSIDPVVGFIGGQNFWFHPDNFTSTSILHPPRYEVERGKLVRVEPFKGDGSYNIAYDVASIEVAYVMVRSVMNFQVPKPQQDTHLEPLDALLQVEYLWPNGGFFDGGFFLATYASAAVPLKVENGFTFIFRRF
jgi:hypothetical protein